MGASRSRRVRRFVVAGLATALLAGCTYAADEPGLFGRTPDAGPTPSRTQPAKPASQAAIPLLGEATWTTAGAPGIGVRIAVHGVRRVPGGTVLDWSVTALSGPEGSPGDRPENGVALDLDEATDIALLDAGAGRVYRPLVARDGSERCLCAPARLAAQNLTLDSPRLLQVAFPELPAAARVIDVVVAPVPVFPRIPVAPLGEVAAPIAETDLARPVEAVPPQARTPAFTLPSGQGFAIEVERVLASGTTTSVVWTLVALTRGPGPGPGLAAELSRNQAWRLTPLRARATGAEPRCLCSDPAKWRDELTAAGRRVTVVTNYGELPRGSTRVDLRFPRVPPLDDVLVTPASDGAFRAAGTNKGPRGTWSFRTNRPQPGWPLTGWPTPTPVITEGDFTPTVERIVD